MWGETKIRKLTILVPCYNEEDGIGIVLDNVPRDRLTSRGYDVETVVIDNNSKDRTAEIAEAKAARVISEKRQGKGYAMMTGFKSVNDDSDIVVMIDGDSSYDIREIERLIEPIESGFGDVVVGSRLHGKMATESMSAKNRWGNWLFTFLARVGYKTNVTDVCSGFFAWKKQVVDNLIRNIESRKFTIEMEMIAKMSRMNYQCYSVPISYNSRNGNSSLRPFKDGVQILQAWAKYLRWKPKEPKKAE